MAQLLIYDELAPQESLAENRFGGLPLHAAGATVSWPICKACDGAMQFLGQLLIPSAGDKSPELLIIFMCGNDPGLCDEWDAEMGGNCVLIAPATDNMSLMTAPTSGNFSRGTTYGAHLVEHSSKTYHEACEKWASNEAAGQYVLGQLFGEPDWLQNDEPPDCNSCKQPMRFVAQLEEGPQNGDYKSHMNFGGGCAYVFDCSCEPRQGKMLWQQ